MTPPFELLPLPLGVSSNEHHVMFRGLPPVAEHQEAGAFAPGLNLFRPQPVRPRRSLLTRALWMEFRHDGQGPRGKQPSHVVQNAGRILGMVQDHRDQRRIRAKARRLQYCGVRDEPQDVRDSTFLLKAFQVGQGFGRTVNRVYDAPGSHPVGEHQAHVAGPRA